MMTLADPNKQAFCNVLKFTMMSNFLNQCSKFLLTVPNVPMIIGIMMMIIIIRQQEHLFSKVKYVNLSVSALGVFDQLSQSFLDMLKDLNYNPSTRNYIVRKISNIAIRTTYYIFCRRDKDWDSPNLLSC